MMYLIVLVLATVASIQASSSNPSFKEFKDYYTPSAVKFGETYYVTAHVSNMTQGIFPIYTSTDLKSWEFEGYLFDNTNRPLWARPDSYMNPQIHKLGCNYVLYYTGYNSTDASYAVGSAIASNPLGPYTPTDRPLLAVQRESARDSDIIKDQGQLYLVWRHADNTIRARPLNSNGLSVASTETTTLLKPTFDWESRYIWSVKYVHRRKYHYLFYDANIGCQATRVGVARSLNPLGPYEKLETPILVPNNNFDCTGSASVVKDLDGKGDVVVFNGVQKYSTLEYKVALATLSWGSDNWPYVIEF